jgi:hypothetical protein
MDWGQAMWSTSYDENNRIHVITIFGEEKATVFREILSEIKSRDELDQYIRVLVVIETTNCINFIDIYQVIKILEQYKTPAGAKVAVIRESNCDDEVHKNHKFFQDVFNNRHLPINFFAEKYLAIEWLNAANHNQRRG